MPPERYAEVPHLADNGSTFIVLASDAGSETRARRVGGVLYIESWARTEVVTVAPGAISALKALGEGSDAP